MSTKCLQPKGPLDKTDEDFIEMCNAGIFVGELNLFTGETRKRKLVVLEEVSIWTITRESLLQMQDKALSLAFVFQSIAMRYAGHRMNLFASSTWKSSNELEHNRRIQYTIGGFFSLRTSKSESSKLVNLCLLKDPTNSV